MRQASQLQRCGIRSQAIMRSFRFHDRARRAHKMRRVRREPHEHLVKPERRVLQSTVKTAHSCVCVGEPACERAVQPADKSLSARPRARDLPANHAVGSKNRSRVDIPRAARHAACRDVRAEDKRMQSRRRPQGCRSARPRANTYRGVARHFGLGERCAWSAAGLVYPSRGHRLLWLLLPTEIGQGPVAARHVL